jgi:hypothetical protein
MIGVRSRESEKTMSAEAYLAARAAFSATAAELKSMTDVLATVASSLQSDPLKFIFANQGIGLPMEASMSRGSRSVDANAWPTVQQIMQLLERYHQQKGQLETAWGALPQNMRDGMKAPDDLIPGRGYGGRGY